MDKQKFNEIIVSFLGENHLATPYGLGCFIGGLDMNDMFGNFISDTIEIKTPILPNTYNFGMRWDFFVCDTKRAKTNKMELNIDEVELNLSKNKDFKKGLEILQKLVFSYLVVKFDQCLGKDKILELFGDLYSYVEACSDYSFECVKNGVIGWFDGNDKLLLTALEIQNLKKELNDLIDVVSKNNVVEILSNWKK